MKVEYVNFMTKSSSLPSTLSELRNVEASVYTCYQQSLRPNDTFKYIINVFDALTTF